MSLSPHDLTIPNAVTIYLFQGQLMYNFPIIFSLYTFASEIIFSTSFDFLQFSMFWVKVFKNGLSKIFYRLSFTNFTWYFLEYLDPFYLVSNCFKVHQQSSLMEFIHSMPLKRTGKKYLSNFTSVRPTYAALSILEYRVFLTRIFSYIGRI